MGTSVSGQRAVIIGLGVVSSRDVNGRIGRGIRAVTFAVKHAGRRRSAGDAGGRASNIGPVNRVENGGGSRADGIGSAVVSGI